MADKHRLPAGAELRSYGMLNMRAVEEGTFIEGHAGVYDQQTKIGDWFYEVIERGAFNGCNFDDVLFCTNHDLQKIPLARSRRNNGNSTMQLRVDDIGLQIRASLDIENNSESKALYSAVTRGDIDGMSFIFFIGEEVWENLDTKMPTRRIKKISRVMEVSAVNFPAYAGTDINARDQTALDNAKSALENARSQLDNSNSELELLRLKNQILSKG
ncbi:HK97 family phage prohead protease [Paenibacillus sp. MMS18-CY102]|uniref:HK97 family phage prohead protease n=1 Tax=Paenibacillus sp. MMS18-CY102 TaxID=2682849 RepID=UPI0013663182|nr:HK97 family phage prohead protease [Paenibacillus sp. MMS18-CY102]MWC26640.1 HK97 family phage prohead protease [Paenibacillus sp. MMS18-CY102]